jgi:hypothetical protein
LKKLLIPTLAFACVLALPFVPRIDLPNYFDFADQRSFFGIPNFWNVVSNVPFLLVALWGARSLGRPQAFLESWERVSYAAFLTGIALVTFGSAYFHLHPSDATLVWDRLPMTIAFTSLFASVTGERLSPRAGKLLLAPLLAAGVASVFYWYFTDDVRPYGLIQYFPMLAIPLMLLLYPPRYTAAWGIPAMIGLYAIAKALETFDRPIGDALSTGGHRWKHIAAAAAVLCYIVSIQRRKPLCYPDPQ